MMEITERYVAAMELLDKTARPGQLKLIEVGMTAGAGDRELVRAPTSTGKSLGALFIAGLRAERGERTVISTYTKLLQNQYRDSDLVEAQQIFPDVDFQVLKGADNYLCRIAAGGIKNGNARYLQLANGTGDPGEVAYGLEQARANWRSCGKHEDWQCGYAAAKKRAHAADVVITNHAIVLINGGIPAVLGKHDLLIVDEIHNLPRAAESFGAGEVDLDQAAALLARLFGYAGAQLGDRLLATLWGEPREERMIEKELAVELETAWRKTVTATGDSDTLENLGTWLTNARLFHENRGAMTVMPVVNKKHEYRGKSYQRVHFTPIDIGPVTARALTGDLVIQGKKDEPDIPFSRAVLMMSATVGTPDKPTYVAERCGVTARLTEVESPIPYSTGMMISLVQRPFGQSMQEAVWQAVRETKGRTLVLCRAWSNQSGQGVKEIYEHLYPILNGKVGLYCQTAGDAAANALAVKNFTEDVDSVLVGTASFNEGINVEGEALSQVIIVMLPKLMPWKNPLEQERIRRKGGLKTWTVDNQIPHTALVLEQQMGRLLRSVSDRGLIAIVDDEAKKGWGLTVVQQASAAMKVPVVPRDHAVNWFRKL